MENKTGASKPDSSKFLRWVKDIIFIVAVVFITKAFVLQAYYVPTPSMEKTVLVGDRLFSCQFFYGIKIPFTNIKLIKVREPRQKEIVIFRSPFERLNLVKRCIGVEGDVVEIRNKKAYVNNKLLNEPYIQFKDPTVYEGVSVEIPEYQNLWEHSGFINCRDVRDNFGPVKVPEGYIFVMGDNRDDSFDSRFWGPLHKKWLLGKSLILFFSLNSDVPFYKIWQKVRWNRIGKIVW